MGDPLGRCLIIFVLLACVAIWRVCGAVLCDFRISDDNISPAAEDIREKKGRYRRVLGAGEAFLVALYALLWQLCSQETYLLFGGSGVLDAVLSC